MPQLVHFTVAQLQPPPAPNNLDQTAPIISIQSPLQDQIYNTTDIWLNGLWLNGTVFKPQIWFTDFSAVYGKPIAYMYWGQITSIKYTLDGENETIPVNDAQMFTAYQSIQPNNCNFSVNLALTGLSDGTHNISVWSEGQVYDSNASSVPVESSVQEIIFSINFITPRITILTIRNETYSTTNIPLTFTVDMPVSWVGYNLDGQGIIKVAGNTTIGNLSVGQHSVIVYANDTDGHIGVSKPVYFTIAQETTPSPTTSTHPSLSPTPLSTQEPFPTMTFIGVSGALAVVVVVAGLLVYFKKHKR
jgi:hypothetical protein